ncbi:MAG: aldehyde ferredoxin oxidoreductase N-terminal domain-containing protein [Clostridia bacterium]|nr:aldehyde dehydrogenase [Clostridia bacterium]MDH7572806.1 aldehyde ferredoxin oxidoreductase N-terminal domain-containing protein [Clostridia bacterium]
MRYAETGYNLEVDLSTGKVEKVETDPRWTELFLGGLGTNARLIWDRVPPEADAFSEENILVISAGLLVGTPVIGANRAIVSSISPTTGLFVFSMAGGFFGPELKHAGYDKIIIKGKSPKPVYLWIHNDHVEIRDASHLRGKGSLETIELLRQELKDPRAQGIAIGPAGENRVYFASIETTRGSFSRAGVGAVMGDKGLKAVMVRGTREVNVLQPREVYEFSNEVLRFIRHRKENPLKGVQPIHETIGAPQEMVIDDEEWHCNNFAWGHARQRRRDFWNKEVEQRWAEITNQVRKRLIGCYNCPLYCTALISVPGYYPYHLKCFTKLTYVLAAYGDLDFGFKINSYSVQYGFDGYSAAQVCAFAVELYENGILTDKDMPGFPSNNEERFFWLLDKIAHREGIGDILADGVYRAARQIGRGAEAFDHNTIKKLEQVPIKLGMLNPIYFLMWSTNEKGNITQVEGQVPQVHLTPEQKENFIKDWVQLPTKYADKIKAWLRDWQPRGERSYPFWPSLDTVCALVDWQEVMHYLDDCLGLCSGLDAFAYKPPYHVHNMPHLLKITAGLELDEESLWDAAVRVRTLVRAINNSRGLRRKDDKPPEDHWKHRFPEYEAKLIDAFYQHRGWNQDGIPTKETLERLQMGFVAEEFIRRGILTEAAAEAK